VIEAVYYNRCSDAVPFEAFGRRLEEMCKLLAPLPHVDVPVAQAPEAALLELGD
jgi:hypothetical protein